ncbi:GpE family phage tail protein [Escherichia coli]|nr:GpE family phage tail protein [Escherichia coli]EHR9096940.1 GpE family phage tail protein [Escherichia coli]EIM2919075.1 GpE family phage tail protein [Escherichia coli]EIM2935037.1 GpE family phage tail protein [Escherichia coli]EIM2940342.1 GpE family phage tail protein [Escherichia coli]
MSDWQDRAAELTWFFHWPPRDAWGLTATEIAWWCDQARRINAIRSGEGGK